MAINPTTLPMMMIMTGSIIIMGGAGALGPVVFDVVRLLRGEDRQDSGPDNDSCQRGFDQCEAAVAVVS